MTVRKKTENPEKPKRKKKIAVVEAELALPNKSATVVKENTAEEIVSKTVKDVSQVVEKSVEIIKDIGKLAENASFTSHLSVGEEKEEEDYPDKSKIRPKRHDPITSYQGSRSGEELHGNIAYDEDKANKLIDALGNNESKVRAQAQDFLQRMGPKVIPQLEVAAKTNKNPEIQQRATAAIANINKPPNPAYTQDWFSTADAIMPEWQKLLKSADASMDNQLPANQAATENDLGTLTRGNSPTAPAEEEQQAFDELIKKLDGLKTGKPEFQNRLAQMREKIFAGTATVPEKEEYFKLYWLDRSRKEARLLYADCLASSKNENDLKKSRDVLMDHMHKNSQERVESDSLKIMTVACKLGIHKDPKFKKAFEAKGGSLRAEEIGQLRERFGYSETL